MTSPPIDIIVPVYRGLAETRRCIDSVLSASQRTAFELIVINDASPEPALGEWLRRQAAAGRLSLLENATNLGFVQTVNRGMSLHPERDVILLNSDTEVANDWLDRLAACATANLRAGTLTPWSNNATICSYPFEGWTGGVPGTLGLAGLDRLIAASLPGRTVEIPTGVGFCMYIRRACLDEVGLFDAGRFGRGYGEENDFCRRAAARGWSNLLAADVFVFHEGGVSFSSERAALQENAMKRLLEAHPDYLEVVMAWIARDPADPLRTCLDAARSARGLAEEAHVLAERGRSLPLRLPDAEPPEDRRPIQLHISHGWGGGIERWIHDFCRADTSRRNLWLRSCSDRNAAGHRLALLEPALGEHPILEWQLALPIRHTALHHPEYARVLASLLDHFEIGAILISSLIGHSLDVLQSGRPTVFVMHDLYPFCPALFGHFDAHCGECDEARLKRCLRHNPLNVFWHNSQASEWLALRKAFAERITGDAVTLVAPTRSVRERWAELLPAVTLRPWHRIAHGLAQADPAWRPSPPRQDDRASRLKLVIPGRLAPHKGLALLESCLPALTRIADITLLGCGAYGRAFESVPGVKVVADYSQAELPARIAEIQPDAALLLSTLAESFSYTLSEMFAFGLPVIAIDQGAFAERVTASVTGLLVLPTPRAVEEAVAKLDADPPLLRQLARGVKALPPRSAVAMVEDYHRLPCLTLPAVADATHRLLDGLHTTATLRQHVLDARVDHMRQAHDHRTADLIRERDGFAADTVRLRTELETIRNSRSWRMTGYLRTLAQRIRRIVPGQDAPPAAPLQAAPRPAPTLPPVHLRAEIRQRVRSWFHLPDRARLFLSLGVPDDAGTFLTRVERLSGARNDFCFVLGGLGADHPCWQGRRVEMESLLARRKLFFSPSLHDRESFLWAADLFVAANGAQLIHDLPDIERVQLPLLRTPDLPRPALDSSAVIWMDEHALLRHWPFHDEAVTSPAPP